MTSPPASLDDTVGSVWKALRARDVAAPDALYLLATGSEGLCEELRHGVEIPLGDLDDVPDPWSAGVLHAGRLGASRVWLCEDTGGEPGDDPLAAPWVAAFPVWLAAAAGAGVCVHVSAGTALPSDAALPVGGLLLARDHVNVSGRTPLLGLGASRLGPLFPDLSHLHHLGLRRAALDAAERLGLQAAEGVVACTAGPALETAAERALYARLGADVAVQSLAAPLLAAGHAGLAVLALVVVLDAGEETADVARLLERAAAATPGLEELLLALEGDVASAVATLREDEGR